MGRKWRCATLGSHSLAVAGPSGISCSSSSSTSVRSRLAASAFSRMWPPFRLPAIAAVTRGWCRTQAIATCATVAPRWSATGRNPSATAKLPLRPAGTQQALVEGGFEPRPCPGREHLFGRLAAEDPAREGLVDRYRDSELAAPGDVRPVVKVVDQAQADLDEVDRPRGVAALDILELVVRHA